MGLGLGTGNGEGGSFLPLLKFDSRSGRMAITQRKQHANGSWGREDIDITRQQPEFVVDFRTIEVGWIEFGKPPAFAVVPLGEPMPKKPGDGFKQGFRVKVAGKVLAAPDGGIVREWATTAKCVINALNDLHNTYEQAPEAADGKIPVVKFVDTTPIKTQTPQGTTTNYAPVFDVVKWVDRPEMLGAATVPLPGKPATPAPKQTTADALQDEVPF